MYPFIHLTQSISISMYSLAVTSAIVLAVIVAYFECKRYKIPLILFPGGAFWAVLGGIIGAKIFEVIFFEWDIFLHSPLATISSPGGWMYYGAEFGGFVGLTIYLVVHRINVLRPYDLCGVVLLLAHAVGRIGCFCSGCCYGTPTESFLGVKFPNIPDHVHPTQLYESIPLIIAFLVFWLFRKRFVIPGTVYAPYLIFYGTLRFIIEFYRFDAYTFGILHLSPSQYISMFVFCAGVGLFWYSWKRFKRTGISDSVQ